MSNNWCDYTISTSLLNYEERPCPQRSFSLSLPFREGSMKLGSIENYTNGASILYFLKPNYQFFSFVLQFHKKEENGREKCFLTCFCALKVKDNLTVLHSYSLR